MAKKAAAASPSSSPGASPKSSAAKSSASSPSSSTMTAPPSSPRKRVTGGGPSTLVIALSIAAAVAAIGLGSQHSAVLERRGELDRAARRLATTFTRARVAIETAFGGNPSKYDTDVVLETPREFVSAAAAPAACVNGTEAVGMVDHGRLRSVLEAMAAPVRPDRVFFMLNGRNEGMYVQWNGDWGCFGHAATSAARWLGADGDEIANGVRAYSPMGVPIRSAEDLTAAGHRVHVLLDFQLWVWPGIQKGHRYVLEDGVVLTTVGMSPKVYDVEKFFTAAEAEEIIRKGLPGLNRSKVDGANSSSVVSTARTSHTAFLDDDAFTRDFRRRSARVARLPSPAHAERLQLVRYAAGEFYRQHLDTFHSREFLPKDANVLSMGDYETWATWAAETLRQLPEDVAQRVPDEFREGGALFPVAEDNQHFPNALLKIFYDDAAPRNFFLANSDDEWATWLRDNLEKDALNVMPALLKADGKPNYLPEIVRVWEARLGLPELRYTFPKQAVNGVTHFFRWVRWAKERITFLGDRVPAAAQHGGALFPKYTVDFQTTLLDFILDDYSDALLTQLSNHEWVAWLHENRGRTHVLFKAMQVFPHVTEVAIRSWEARVGVPTVAPELHYTFPKYVRHFHPQRYVTLFLYLNDQAKVGGETVFPYSVDRFSDETIERTGMSECSTGLAVPPRGLHASLFYCQTPEGEVDMMSRHGGCPPHEGVKWGSNSFMWNADADEGADLWTTK